MGLFRRLDVDDSDPPATATKSGVVPAMTREREGLAKLWDDSLDDEEITGETAHMPPSRRSKGNPRLTIMTGVSAGQVVSVDLGASDALIIGRSRGVDLRLEDDGISRQHCRIVRRDSHLVVEDLSSTNGTIVNGTRVASAELKAGDRIQLGPNMMLQVGMFDDAEETLARRLFDSSTRDELTRAYNRRHFGERLAAEVANAQRQSSPLSVIIVGVNDLLAVNDTLGAAVGDEVLKAVAGAIAETVREEHLFCRYGGGQFALMVRESAAGAARLGERLRTRIAATRVHCAKKPVQVTASLGIAEIGDPGAQLTGDGLLRVAEKRFWRAVKSEP
jgi:diguanylate cyclase (GGDEF)-like protein